MSLQDYFKSNGDKIGATVAVAIIVASIVGFRRRSTPMALFVSNVSSALLAGLLFPVAQTYGYSWEVAIPVIGLGSGTCAFAAFSVLMRVADRLEARGDQLADRVIDKVLPESKE